MRDCNLLKRIPEATQEVWDRPGTRAEVRNSFAAVIDCATPALGWTPLEVEKQVSDRYQRAKPNPTVGQEYANVDLLCALGR